MLFQMLRTEAAHYFMEQSQWNHAILFQESHCSFQKQRCGALWVTADGSVLQGVFKCMCVLCVYRGFIGADASLAGFTRRPLLWKVNERSAWTSSYLLSHSYSLLVLISQFLCVLPSPHLSFIFPLFRHLTTLHLLICTANWIKGSFRKVFLIPQNPITVPMTLKRLYINVSQTTEEVKDIDFLFFLLPSL